jgi:hypothetical protein
MAIPNIIVDTTFSGKNIASAASVYEFVVPATGTYRIQVRLAAVAGGGDYVAYLTLNDGDLQTDDPMLPKTTLTAAAGELAFWFATMTIDALVGDVINVMVDGLAGDTSEAGSVRIFADSSLDAVALPPTGSGLTALGDTRIANLDAKVSDVKTNTDKVGSAMEVDGAVNRFTANALELAPVTAAGPTAEAIRTEMDDHSSKLARLDVAVSTRTKPADTQARVALVDVCTENTDQVDAAAIDAALSVAHGPGRWDRATGSGSVLKTYTQKYAGVALAGCEVWVTTDLAGTAIIAGGVTDALGKVYLYPDVPAGTTLYIWRKKVGYEFVNPDLETM